MGGKTPIFDTHWSFRDRITNAALLSTNAYALSGNLSGYVNNNPVTGVNALLLLGDKIFGPWALKFSLYIPSGKVGYWNIQGQEVPGIQSVVGNIFMAHGIENQGIGEIDYGTADIADDTIFAFPHDEWFEIRISFDFNLGAELSTWQMWIAGEEVIPGGTPFQNGEGEPALAIGAINFYAISEDNEMHVDDVEFINEIHDDLNLGLDDTKATGFIAYPNPVINELNVQAKEEITSIAIYNVFGQELYNQPINTLNYSIDMSSFDPCAYLVKVSIGTTEETIKVFR